MNIQTFKTLSTHYGHGEAAREQETWQHHSLLMAFTANIGFFLFILRPPFCPHFSVLLIITVFVLSQGSDRCEIVLPELLTHL